MAKAKKTKKTNKNEETKKPEVKKETLKKENEKKAEIKTKKPEVKTDKKKDVKENKKRKEKSEKKDSEKKIEKPEVKKTKKSEAIVNASDIPISTKHSIALCKFIKGKSIKKALSDLELVMEKRKPIPMKGEIPHRRGKGMASGRFPVKTAKNFHVLLKSLQGNATYNEIENPVIVEAVSNQGSRPYGRFGRVRKKRTHIKIIAKEKTQSKEKNK